MTDVRTIRSTAGFQQLEDGMEVVVIGDFLAYDNSPEYNSELTEKSDRYKVLKNCRLKLADGKAVSVAFEDKVQPLPSDDELLYPPDTDTPLSGKPVERYHKVAVHATVELTTDPHSGRKLPRLITHSSQLQPALLS